MQLLLRRSQRAGGLTGTMIFCLDARVQFTAREKQDIQRYKLGGQVIYNSEASKRALAKSEAAGDGSALGSVKGLAFAALAAMKLNISINSLERGQHVECKSLDELLGAEEAVMTACQNLRGYLDTAATFDGQEVVFDFSTETPTLAARAPALPPPIAASRPPPSVPAVAPPPVAAPLAQDAVPTGDAPPMASTAIRGATAGGTATTGDIEDEAKVVLLVICALAVILILYVVLAHQTGG